MTDLATTYILLSNTDKLKEQVWFHQDELIKLREQYKQLEAERDRLRNQLKYYQDFVIQYPPIKWYAIKDADPVPVVPTLAFADLIAERDRLRTALERIATDNDCDPRAEARNALEEGKDDD